MKKIYQYILLVVAMVATASCSNELDDTLQPVENGTLQFVVGDFPAFGEDPQTRASSFGTPDEGKTAWETNDEITVILTSDYYGEQTATLTYGEDGTWVSSGTLSYLENETPAVSVVYNPCAETPGLGEYLVTTDCTLANNALNITFEDATRTYSRLRIATLADLPLAVTTTGFTPAGAEEAGEHSYTLTADDKGNAYLYGIFAEGATVIVKQGDITLKDYTFTAEKNPNGTEHNKSYALDATPVIDGTLGGKTEATEDDITALVEQLKAYVDNGITTIIVPGSEPALIEMDSWTNTAIGEAIYRLSKEESYNGKIDLILPDVTEIFDQEFHSARALNSITLPKVTKLADQAFYGTLYLRTITFGSVITEVNELGAIFNQVGYKVGGCDLILNCGQMNESNVPAPDLTNNIWKFKFENEFKSITLTHTGECDECKANQ